MNLYAYVGNNPLNRTDPTGNVSEQVDKFKGQIGASADKLYNSNFSVTAEGYRIVGGGVNISWDHGALEATGKVGLGYGTSFSYDPTGKPSEHTLPEGSGYIARQVADVSASTGIAVVAVGGAFRASTANAVTTPDFGKGYYSYTDKVISVDPTANAKLGMSFSASVSSEFGSYSHW
ncbi:hypothetical protein D3C76_982190 [compost metagenome]